MNTFISMLVIGFGIYLLIKLLRLIKKQEKSLKENSNSNSIGNNNQDFPFKLKITPAEGFSSEENPKDEIIKPIKQNLDGFWILNPGTPFELTLLTNSKKIALKVREILDGNKTDDSYANSTDELLVIFLENDLKVKEFEDYKCKYKDSYKNRIGEMISKSKEWVTSYEDREDLLKRYRDLAVKEIYERISDDLSYSTLFEWEPKITQLDIELIHEFGFQNISTYLRYYMENHDKIHIVPYGNKQRPIFENLVKQGLADNGFNLSKEDILNILSLKELNEIAKNPDLVFKRKKVAIDFLLRIDNIEDKIGQKIALRELFKLKSLPDKYLAISIEDIFKEWDYYYEVIGLIWGTYSNSYNTIMKLSDNKEIEFYKISYSIELPYEKYPCKRAQERKNKTFTKNNIPKVPCHIGCHCNLLLDYVDI